MSGRLGLNAKLTLVTLAAILLSLFAAGLVFILYERHNYRQAQLYELRVLTEVISDHVAAGALFNDPARAAESLAALAVDATLSAACLVARDGSVLAIYRRDPGTPICDRARHADAIESDANHVLMVKRVLVDGDAVGEIQVRASLEELNKRLNRIIGFVLLIAAGVTSVVLLLSRRLQDWLTRPILDLSDMARRVARDKDCSVRAGKSSEDELGVLVDAFNGMLETIEMQNRRQLEGQQRLEALVAERTAALEQAQASLLRQERLATLGKLTGTVSHELRNPLGTIQTSVDVLRRSLLECAPDVDRTLQRIERNIHRCETIINELLDYSRGSPPNRQRVQADGWLRDILAGYPHPLRIECERVDAVSAEFDPERLRRAVINVLDNAWQACSERQTPAQDAPCARISLRAGTGRLEIMIADNGAGMSEDVRARVFEPLFSTRAFGIGLGLAIVKQILEQHAGGVELASIPGQGTQVRLWMPWSEE